MVDLFPDFFGAILFIFCCITKALVCECVLSDVTDVFTTASCHIFFTQKSTRVTVFSYTFEYSLSDHLHCSVQWTFNRHGCHNLFYYTFGNTAKRQHVAIMQCEGLGKLERNEYSWARLAELSRRQETRVLWDSWRIMGNQALNTIRLTTLASTTLPLGFTPLLVIFSWYCGCMSAILMTSSMDVVLLILFVQIFFRCLDVKS